MANSITGLEKYEKKVAASKNNRAILLVMGGILGIFSFLVFRKQFDQEMDAIWVALIPFFICMIGSITNDSQYRKGTEIISLYKQVVTILNSHPDGSLSTIAAHTQQNMDECIKNLEFMIRKNLFVNANVDRMAQRLVINWRNNPYLSENDSANYVVKICPDCGGHIRVPKGDVTNCDYCGKMLSGL